MKNKEKFPINVLSFKLPNDKKFYTPLSDIVFRSIFASSGNEHITKAFLEAITPLKLDDFSLSANPEFARKYIQDKKQTTDVKAECINSGDKILVEMQYRAIDDVNNRFTSYGEKAHLENLKKNSVYAKLPKVIMIIIMGENLPELEGKKDYLSVFNDRDEKCPKCLFSEGVTKYVIELPKYIKLKEETDEKDLDKVINPWLEFLIDPLGKEVEKNMRSIEELMEAVEKLRELNNDDEVREFYETQQIDMYYRELERASAEKKGRDEGIIDGKIAMAISMFKNNISIEDIAKITNFDISEVRKIVEPYVLEKVN